MPPKDKGKEKDKKKNQINWALELQVEGSLKKFIDTLGKSKAPMEPVAPFVKRLKNEITLIKDGEQLDTPNIPLFVMDPTPYDTCRSLFAALESYQWLRQISFYHCKIGDDGAMVIAEFLCSYQPNPERNPFGVEILDLPENDIGPRGAGFLGKMLTQNESVKSLNLDFNPLGDEGVGLLGDGLKWNSTVQTLSMQYCDIGPEGGEMVAKYVVRSSSVKELSLRGNPMGPHGVTMIGRSLAKNAYLVKLDLADTSFGIDLEAVEALRDGIEGNDSLETVDLNLNSMVPAGVQLLCNMLKTKPKLTNFVLYERIGEGIFRDIVDTVYTNLKNSKKKKKKGGKKGASPPGSKPGTAPEAAAKPAAPA